MSAFNVLQLELDSVFLFLNSSTETGFSLLLCVYFLSAVLQFGHTTIVTQQVVYVAIRTPKHSSLALHYLVQGHLFSPFCHLLDFRGFPCWALAYFVLTYFQNHRGPCSKRFEQSFRRLCCKLRVFFFLLFFFCSWYVLENTLFTNGLFWKVKLHRC